MHVQLDTFKAFQNQQMIYLNYRWPLTGELPTHKRLSHVGLLGHLMVACLGGTVTVVKYRLLARRI